ncbi:hypothetical protein AGOR_G00135010 [Albula goreensis]|uniref:Uncharacterized protein n=1 Tax=Albula goreensis TaxID=1534307 RepID=A0A8T3DAE2_9TELE|nr:hypothetical protein AGOR_G00135010 [Albula goreensis]
MNVSLFSHTHYGGKIFPLGMMAAVEQNPLERPHTAHWTGVKTQSMQPLQWKTCWTPPYSRSQRYFMSSLVKDPQSCENEREHLPSTEHIPKCPTNVNASADQFTTKTSAHFTGSCRCSPPLREISDEELVRGPEEMKPSSASPALANSRRGEKPWYLTVIHEKEQCLLKLGEEITCLSDFESQCSRKDHEISALQRKLAEVTNQLHQAHNNEVVTAQAELILP